MAENQVQWLKTRLYVLSFGQLRRRSHTRELGGAATVLGQRSNCHLHRTVLKVTGLHQHGMLWPSALQSAGQGPT